MTPAKPRQRGSEMDKIIETIERDTEILRRCEEEVHAHQSRCRYFSAINTVCSSVAAVCAVSAIGIKDPNIAGRAAADSTRWLLIPSLMNLGMSFQQARDAVGFEVSK